jgi:hypothetical protein
LDTWDAIRALVAQLEIDPFEQRRLRLTRLVAETKNALRL